ncbi:MAG TPA: hypothetical protein VMS99_17570, partial [Acidimicrobiia bacterium]|nr:hypothetical protein [Acidimicrobiia bacterium]
MRPRRSLTYLTLITALALIVAACGDDQGGDTTTLGTGTTVASSTTQGGTETTAATETTTASGEPIRVGSTLAL